MKKPRTPPSFSEFQSRIFDQDPKRLRAIMTAARSPCVNGCYRHWHKLRYLVPPEGLSHEDWWFGLKFSRMLVSKQLPLKDATGHNFHYCSVDPLAELTHQIDRQVAGTIGLPEDVLRREDRNVYIARSLIEEAIASSQLEGAHTTRDEAKRMLREGRRPSNKSERMILNNYVTMQHVAKLRGEALTPDLVCEIHRLVTLETLVDPAKAGCLRADSDAVRVEDMYGEVFHVPPPAAQLPSRLEAMCHFANGETPSDFLHPAVRAAILHFWLAYDHPFVDGNGRTARALFYWSMLHNGFWLSEYLPISMIFRSAPAKYGRAFLYVESDDNDLTYFVLYHLGVVRRAVADLAAYIEHRSAAVRDAERRARGLSLFNHRQRELVSHALRHPTARYSIEGHRASHMVSYQTARLDLHDLAERGLFVGAKVRKTWYFRPAADLERRLQQLDEEP